MRFQTIEGLVCGYHVGSSVGMYPVLVHVYKYPLEWNGLDDQTSLVIL